MKLESLARLNGFDTSNAHDAMTDTELTVLILDQIKKKQPELWLDYFRTSSKQVTEDIIRKEKIITLNEHFYGRSRLYCCAPLHPNSFIHPIFRYAQVVDLRIDPEPLFKLSYQELKEEMKKTPKFLRTVRSNKAPVLLAASYGMKVEPYNSIDPDLIKKRAEMIKSNEKFAIDVCNILRENAEEKIDTSSQLDIEPEESLYSGGFERLNKDQYLFEKWHQADWKTKFSLLSKFHDDRNIIFAQQILFNEAPEVLPEDIYKQIKRKIASRILSSNKEKWFTVYDCYKEIDDIRENDGKMFSFKSKEEKLNFLEGINKYVMELEQKYSKA
jgi:exodeoxyribonuclease-1